MAKKTEDSKPPISAAPVAIATNVNATKSHASSQGVALKGTTESRLRPDQAVMASLNGQTPETPDDIAYKNYMKLLLIDNGSDLVESLPSLNTFYDKPVSIGEQQLNTRQDVARSVDRLSEIGNIARGTSTPTREYQLDFKGIPLESFKTPNPSNPNLAWNRVTSSPIKVDQNFSLNGSFQQAFQIVLASEGGFSNHRNDKGGATIYGIASRSNPAEYAKIMEQLSRGDKDGAMQTTMMTYKTKYWDTVNGIEGMSPSARLVAFDAAVNHGVGFANKMIAKTGADADSMLDFRAQKYASIISNDPSQAIFEKGWANRMAKLDKLTNVSEGNQTLVASVKPVGGLRTPEPA